ATHVNDHVTTTKFQGIEGEYALGGAKSHIKGLNLKIKGNCSLNALILKHLKYMYGGENTVQCTRVDILL
ncbi:MAG: hypothetical protein MJE68_31100, partial [Proteobacteria bacterium]|nr:hypothetical protein [Pseudomonadota bacterium]